VSDRSQNDAAYCASKAQEFVAKLNDMGWDCGQQAEVDEPVDADEPESVDDTDALTPADEIELDDPR
jgi:hypothetical protein